MENLINVSRGEPLEFFADGQPVTGIIQRATNRGSVIAVEVEAQGKIKNGALMTIDESFHVGACGRAKTREAGGQIFVTLEIALKAIDRATIGR